MPEDSAPAKRKLLDVARGVFTPLALTGLAWAAYAARGEISAIVSQARTGPLVVAMLAWASLNLLVPAISLVWLRGLGTTTDYRTLLRIHLDRLPARYLPGGVWHTVTRYLDLSARGVDRQRLAALAVLENTAPPAIALALAALCVSLAGAHPPAVPALLLLGAASLALAPFVILRLSLRALPRLPVMASAAAFARLAAFWLVACFAFIVYWSAFPFVAIAGGVPSVAGAYLLGWTAGFAAIFAPQGLGVFEATVTWLLGGELPFATVVLLAAGFRAVTIAGDLLAYLLSRAWPGEGTRAARSGD